MIFFHIFQVASLANYEYESISNMRSNRAVESEEKRGYLIDPKKTMDLDSTEMNKNLIDTKKYENKNENSVKNVIEDKNKSENKTENKTLNKTGNQDGNDNENKDKIDDENVGENRLNIYPNWLKSALEAAKQGRISDLINIKSEEEKRNIYTLFSDIGKNKENFFKMLKNPYVKGSSFGPDVDVLTMKLPENFPKYAGKAKHAFRHRLKEYESLRRKMLKMELSSSLTPEALEAEKLFSNKNIPGFSSSSVLKYLPR